jgi:hypothetical protein
VTQSSARSVGRSIFETLTRPEILVFRDLLRLIVEFLPADGKKVSGLFSVGSGVRIVCSWEEQDVQTKPAGFITP